MCTAGPWDPARIPEGLTCKNTFFDIPIASDVVLGSGSATCPLPTEGWWSSPSPSRARNGSNTGSPPADEINTPDWLSMDFNSGRTPPYLSFGMGVAPGRLRAGSNLSKGGVNEDVRTPDWYPDLRSSPPLCRLHSGSATQSPILPDDNGPTPDWFGSDVPGRAPSSFGRMHTGSTTQSPILPDDIGPTPDWFGSDLPGRAPSSFGLHFTHLLKEAVASLPDTPAAVPASTLGSLPLHTTACGEPARLNVNTLNDISTVPWTVPVPTPAPPAPLGGGTLGGGMTWGAAPERKFRVELARELNLDTEPETLLSAQVERKTAPLHAAVQLPMSMTAAATTTTKLPDLSPTSGVEFVQPTPPRVLFESSLGADDDKSPCPILVPGPSAGKTRRRRGSKEAKAPDHTKDPAWWLPTAINIDLSDLVRVENGNYRTFVPRKH